MNFKYKGIKIGADPELFLRNKEGKIVSAIGLVGGSKDKPKKIDKKGHAVQEDNVMVEYNIAPASTVKEFVKSHLFVMDYLRKALPDYTLDVLASVEMTHDQLQNPKALVFGCEPDYNAWKMCINPNLSNKTNLRTAGGHIHVGYEGADIDNQVALIRAMDLFIGVPSILLDPDNRRRERYGKAGAFRPKDYGVEFRTPSNFWIRDEKTMAWAYNNSHASVKFLNAGGEIKKNEGARIVETINTGNRKMAEALIKEFSIGM